MSGDSLLITPNHSDHADPHVLIHLARQHGIPFHFIAAREVFEINYGINGRLLQFAGVFSIDREGADIAAIKEAMRIVHEARFPLVMFPEGEIYHLNEQLTSLNEGAATIMLKTAARLRKEGASKKCMIVPTAIQYRYVEDPTPVIREMLRELEEYLHWQPQSQLDLMERIYKFGEAVLTLKEQEFLGRQLSGSLVERLYQFREILISRVEQKYFNNTASGIHPERIRKTRGKIRSLLLAETPPPPEIKAEYYRDLDDLYLAVQLYSYPGQYVNQKPTPDRMAETVLKFEEDLLGRYRVRAQRQAMVTFCPPINLGDYLDDTGKPAGNATTVVTEQIAAALKAVLEAEQ